MQRNFYVQVIDNTDSLEALAVESKYWLDRIVRTQKDLNSLKAMSNAPRQVVVNCRDTIRYLGNMMRVVRDRTMVVKGQPTFL